jgi:hypothetical protein
VYAFVDHAKRRLIPQRKNTIAKVAFYCIFVAMYKKISDATPINRLNAVSPNSGFDLDGLLI